MSNSPGGKIKPKKSGLPGTLKWLLIANVPAVILVGTIFLTRREEALAAINRTPARLWRALAVFFGASILLGLVVWLVWPVMVSVWKALSKSIRKTKKKNEKRNVILKIGSGPGLAVKGFGVAVCWALWWLMAAVSVGLIAAAVAAAVFILKILLS